MRYADGFGNVIQIAPHIPPWDRMDLRNPKSDSRGLQTANPLSLAQQAHNS